MPIEHENEKIDRYDNVHHSYTSSGQYIEVEDQELNHETRELFEQLTPTWTDSILGLIAKALCGGKHEWMLCKYKVVHSLVPHHKGTSLEYQYIRMCLSEQHWKCKNCGSTAPLAQPVAPMYKEEHYL